MKHVVIAGGGTGGHLFPGIAVVEELRRRFPELEVTFVGTSRGIETRVLPDLGYRLELVDVTPLKGRTAIELGRSLARIPAALTAATALLRRLRPDLVLGLGGYAAGPVLAAAAGLGIKSALMEQNARVGMTNRMAAKLVGRAYISFPSTSRVFPMDRVRMTGNPVREAFREMGRRAYVDPQGFEARAKSLLVLGGSQGARPLNDELPKLLAAAGIRCRIRHQTGADSVDAVQAAYRSLGVEAEVLPFIDDMARAVGEAKMVIARAGATTVAELTAVGRAAILVPYPHAADDHQTVNADVLAAAGAAVVLEQSRLGDASAMEEVRALWADSALREEMAHASRRLGHPEAARVLADDLVSWLGMDVPRPPRDHGLRGTRPYVPRSRLRRCSLPPTWRADYGLSGDLDAADAGDFEMGSAEARCA